MTPDDQIDAAELALGLLEGEARAAALERLLADPAFAAEVAWWRDRMAHLAHDYAPVEPPAGLAARIEPPEAGNPVVAKPRRFWPWLVSGALGGALAASLAMLVLAPSPAPPPSVAVAPAPVTLVGVLVSSDGTHAPVAALIDRDGHGLRLTDTILVPDERVAELWRIGGDNVPRAIGLLPRGSRLPVLTRGAVLPGKDETLAISVEPLGGSPTGKPTGPVIASGTLVIA